MPPNKDLVILLHGIMRHKADMLLMVRALKKGGYNTLNILYPSHSKTLEELGTLVHKKLKSCKDYKTAPNIHFVTHSMGGLISRYYIEEHQPKNLGKVIMLAPPNTGSEVADFLDEQKITTAIYKKIWGPAGQQLRTSHTHRDKNTPITYPLGIIAGNKSANPLAFLALKGEHDGIVTVERTKIEGMSDHITLPVNHAFTMFDKEVIRQVIVFLKNAKFEHNAAPANQTKSATL